MTNNFSSIFIFGYDKYINNFLNHINIKTNIEIFNGHQYNIYNYGGIDFIIKKINWNNYIMQELYINDFIKKKNYLLSNIIYIVPYISKRDGNIILPLSSFNKINITLVSMMPTTTFDYYALLCNSYNLKTYIFKDKYITMDDFSKIIKSLYNNKYYYIYDIFINLTII